MKLDIAIKILTQDRIATRAKGDYTSVDALGLAIEALEYIQVWRKALPLTNPQLLLGETEE